MLMAAGLALFDLVVWRPVVRSPLPTAWLAVAFAVVFVSAAALVYQSHAGVSTRFGLVLLISSLVAAVGVTAAVLGTVDRTAGLFAVILALALLAAPTLAGHALDAGRWWANAPIDFLHVLAVAFWFGSLVALVLIVPKLSISRELRGAVVRRFSRLALVTVLVIAATGVGRAVAALASLSQLWTTGYGRAIVVKTALLGLLLVLGWVSRSRIAGAYGKLRESVAAEVVVLLVLFAAVGVLTALPPGRTVSGGRGSIACGEGRPRALATARCDRARPTRRATGGGGCRSAVRSRDRNLHRSGCKSGRRWAGHDRRAADANVRLRLLRGRCRSRPRGDGRARRDDSSVRSRPPPSGARAGRAAGSCVSGTTKHRLPAANRVGARLEAHRPVD